MLPQTERHIRLQHTILRILQRWSGQDDRSATEAPLLPGQSPSFKDRKEDIKDIKDTYGISEEVSSRPACP